MDPEKLREMEEKKRIKDNEEDDPFFYHLDLSNYEESLETYCNDNFFFQDARLNSQRSKQDMDPEGVYQNLRQSN